MSSDRDISREQNAVLDKHVKLLMEHFSTVHIFVTSDRINEKGESSTFINYAARGSYFTRYGQIKEWVLRQEHSMARDRQDLLEKDEDDDE